MDIFVFFVNILTAAFILTFIAEISTLLIGSLVLALELWKRGKKDNG